MNKLNRMEGDNEFDALIQDKYLSSEPIAPPKSHGMNDHFGSKV